MKKSILLIISVLFCVSCFAQNKYLIVSGYVGYSTTSSTSVTYINLSGDIPVGFKNRYNQGGSNHEITLGELINDLVDKGFIIEHFSGGGKDNDYVNLLLSRPATNEDDAISIVHNDDGDVREVARYNLQGMQVNENTKGIQIVVYSNYTTKTVIVE